MSPSTPSANRSSLTSSPPGTEGSVTVTEAAARAAQRLRDQAETGSASLPPLDAPPVVPTIGPRAEEPGEPGAPAALPGQGSTLGLRKFRDRLSLPSVIRAWQHPEAEAIEIRAERARVRHHADLPPAEAWVYNGELPGPTIEARSHRPVRIDWANALFGDGEHPHADHGHPEPQSGHDDAAALPYDVLRVPPHADGLAETVRVANQPGGHVRPEGEGPGTQRPNTYPRLDGTDAIRAATVVHLHGALTDGHNDGWAHNVMMPGHAARCTYPNEQAAGTLWYHDHAMAVTRFTVHAGLAGFYLIRDRDEDALGLPSDSHELQLVIADRNLETEPGDREDFVPTGRLLYKQAGIAGEDPVEIPVTGPFTTVNGTIWPTHEVEPRWYRLRLLNASNARIYRLALYDTTEENVPLDLEDPLEPTPEEGFDGAPDVYGIDRRSEALVVIGTEGGFLPEPVVPPRGSLELAPGERMDVLVDFSALRGRTVELRNENATHLPPQWGQIDPTVMRFTVSDRAVDDPFRLPETLDPDHVRWRREADGTLVVGPDPEHDRIDDYEHVWIGVVPTNTLGNGHPQMWELEDISDLPEDEIGETEVIRLAQPEGEDPIVLRPAAKLFDDTVTILLAERSWALWHVIHMGGPDHPMHIHMTTFQMIERRSWDLGDDNVVPGFDPATGATAEPLPVPEPGPEIDPITAGTKETWVVRGGEHVIVAGHFAGANGTFMYHCHILDHEDHTMMRPFVVLPESLLALHAGHGNGGHH